MEYERIVGDMQMCHDDVLLHRPMHAKPLPPIHLHSRVILFLLMLHLSSSPSGVCDFLHGCVIHFPLLCSHWFARLPARAQHSGRYLDLEALHLYILTKLLVPHLPKTNILVDWETPRAKPAVGRHAPGTSSTRCVQLPVFFLQVIKIRKWIRLAFNSSAGCTLHLTHPIIFTFN